MFNLHMIRTRSLEFLQVGIWYLDDSEQNGWKSFLLKPFRIAILTVHGFLTDKCALQASALTYYTLLAVVPVIAMLLGVARGFGLDLPLERMLYARLAGQEETIARIVAISRNLLQNTRGGLFAGIGVALLFWSAIKVLARIEAALNQIWKVSSRTVLRKFTDYLTILIIAPFLFIISSSINIYISAHISDFTREFFLLRVASPLLVFLLKLLPYGLIWLLFILIYLVIPNTRVKFVSALIGGLIAGAIFQLIQGGYIHTQFLLSRYNAVYGSFAALPLFLIWMQLSWIIVLFGAQIAYAHQHVGLHAMAIDYDQSSPNLRKKYALYVFWALVGQFKAGAGAPTASELADQLDLPYGLIAQALDNLVQARLISSVIRDEVDDFGYQPARDINAVTLMHVLQALEAAGDNELPRQAAPALGRVSEAVENLSQAMFHSKRNTSVKDL